MRYDDKIMMGIPSISAAIPLQCQGMRPTGAMWYQRSNFHVKMRRIVSSLTWYSLLRSFDVTIRIVNIHKLEKVILKKDDEAAPPISKHPIVIAADPWYVYTELLSEQALLLTVDANCIKHDHWRHESLESYVITTLY